MTGNIIKRLLLFHVCIVITVSFLFTHIGSLDSYADELSGTIKSVVRKNNYKRKKKRIYTARKTPFNRSYKSFKMGAKEYALTLSGLPTDRFGLVNWVEATKQGKLSPIVGISRKNKHRFYEGVIIYNATSPTREDVIFPHDVHTYFLDCDSCHPKPFHKTQGQAKISMMKIKRGRFCGKCHGKIAFPIEDCERCHVLPKANIKW